MRTTSFQQMLYLVPFLWAALLSWVVFVALDWWAEKKKPYRQVRFASMGGSTQGKSKKDSRGLLRAVRLMDKGAHAFHIEASYWERLDRRLALMEEKAGARETVTILLLRCLAVSLPIFALSLLMADWRIVCAYPPAAALLFRQEMKSLDRRYSKWQKELARDIPEVMDRLRICFAGGRDYLSALRQARASVGAAMRQALSQLIQDIQTIGSAGAFRLFSVSFDLPAIQKLSSAMVLAVESGYEASEAYFNSIEGEIVALRQEAAESLVQDKPEKIYRLYALLFGLAVAALLLKGWEILGQVGRLFA